jgi:hypothetical protein
MHSPSPALAATLRALRGETDVHVVAPALDDIWCVRIPALAPGVDPVVGALGALAGGLPYFLTPDECASPALSTAIASLIGTNTGARILPWWAEVAPAGWGASHADALIDAVRHGRCGPWAAGALIGPTNDAAALLTCPDDIAHAVRRWGQATPNDPTAWMDDLASAERDRLVHALRTAPNNAAACWPWLPDAIAVDIIGRIDGRFLLSALAAYTAASSVVHVRHAAILSTLMQRAEPDDLDQQIRLAVATGMANAWAAIQRVLHNDPWNAVHVVAAAPWNDLHTDVQAAILSATRRSNICAAIACARGMRDQPPPITKKTARAFFAAVTPEVWTALPAETQQEWRRTLDGTETHLAVRSLGLDPIFLERARLNADMIAAVRRHAPNEETLRRTLLPMAVRDLPIVADVSDVVAALPAPPDPVVFVQIAGGSPTMPPALRAWITAHPIAQTAAAAVTVLRVGRRFGVDRVDTRCAALARAFAGWSSEEATALLTALPKDARAALRPSANALANALAHPDRRDAFRQALDTITALSPSVAIPARHALKELAKALAKTSKRSKDILQQLFQQRAGEELARALRNHGRIFADIVGALNDDARLAVLPRLDYLHDEAALVPLAVADPLVAHRLAHALWAGDMPAAMLDALMAEPLDETPRRWRLLPDTIRSAILGDRDALLRDVAAPGHADALAKMLQNWKANDSLTLLALRMLGDDDKNRRARGTAILAQQPDMAASLLPLLHDDVRTALESVPTIAVAGADLPLDQSKTPALVRRRR